jgi:hypothetical protein
MAPLSRRIRRWMECTRGEGLLELVDLVSLLHDERVKVLAAADLELGVPLVLLDLDPCMIEEAGSGLVDRRCRVYPSGNRFEIAHGYNVRGGAYTGRPSSWR